MNQPFSHPFADRHTPQPVPPIAAPSSMATEINDLLGTLLRECIRAEGRFVYREFSLRQAADQARDIASRLPNIDAIAYLKRAIAQFTSVADKPGDSLGNKLSRMPHDFGVAHEDAHASINGAAAAWSAGAANVEAGKRASDARQMYGQMAARGVLLSVSEDGHLTAAPAHLLSDSDRQKLGEQKGELLKLITSREVF
jgi:hypothetical protein